MTFVGSTIPDDITSEQVLINKFFPNDNTKTISDVLTHWIETDNLEMTTSELLSIFKKSFTNVSDWSL